MEESENIKKLTKEEKEREERELKIAQYIKEQKEKGCDMRELETFQYMLAGKLPPGHINNPFLALFIFFLMLIAIFAFIYIVGGSLSTAYNSGDPWYLESY